MRTGPPSKKRLGEGRTVSASCADVGTVSGGWINAPRRSAVERGQTRLLGELHIVDQGFTQCFIVIDNQNGRHAACSTFSLAKTPADLISGFLCARMREQRRRGSIFDQMPFQEKARNMR